MNHKLFLFLFGVMCLSFSGCLLIYSSQVPEKKYQKNKNAHELSVSYGHFSGTEYVNNNQDNRGDNHFTQISNTGNVFASYHYYLNRKTCVGASIGYQQYTYGWGNSLHGWYYYNQRVSLTTLASEIKYTVVDGRIFQLYGLYGIALTDRKEQFSNYVPGSFVHLDPALSHQGLRFNFQYSPIGFRLGKDIGGFMELGMGYKGLVNGGVFYMVRSRKKKSIK